MSTQPALTPLIERSLAGDLDVREHPTDERIMDAVLEELRGTPLDEVTLDEVAKRAGLTRMTVYRRFGDRGQVIEATMAREVARFLSALVAADDPTAGAGDRIATTFATALTLTFGHPVTSHLLATRPGEFLETLLADDAALVAAGSRFIATHLELGDATGPHPDPQQTGELLARLFIAIVLMPPPSVDLTDPNQARALARDLVVPLVARGRQRRA